MGGADVTSSLPAVMRDIADAAQRAGRDPASVKLIAVSKTVPEQSVEEAIEFRSAPLRREPGAGSEGEVAGAEGTPSRS